MAIEKLELSNTFEQVMDKINEIINTVEENVTGIKLYNSDETQFVTFTYDSDNSTVTLKDEDGKTEVLTLE